VLFVSSTSKIRWARPYLVGFEYSRPDKADQSSEKAQQSAKFNLFRHPLSQGSDALPPSRMSKSEVVLLPKINPIDLIGQESEAKLDLLA
jgi:hypothetical protein